MIVAIIPARGGSKRIPKKNIRSFAGKPIISYSIKAARETGLFDQIIVSTDSVEIARIARKYGASVPFMRPSELADDFIGTDSVILHALNWLFDNGYIVDYLCCIYATAPFLSGIYLKMGYEELRQKNASSAFSVTTFQYPIFRALKINSRGRLEMFWPEYFSSRSQDLPLSLHDAGQFYWADVKKFMKEKKLLSKDAIPIILPNYLVQDIDTLEDWEKAELMYEAFHSTKHGAVFD